MRSLSLNLMLCAHELMGRAFSSRLDLCSAGGGREYESQVVLPKTMVDQNQRNSCSCRVVQV
jgi:hypothetical protein